LESKKQLGFFFHNISYRFLNIFLFLQVITPTRSFVLGAETRREMEDWLTALKTASSREFFEPGLLDQNDFLAGHHNWYGYDYDMAYKRNFNFRSTSSG